MKAQMNRREFIKSVAGVTAAAVYPRALFGSEEGASREPIARAVPKRVLGRTGVEVSVLALGGVVGMIRKPSAEFDPAEFANAAIDMGITYFDTATSYANGLSERNYGEVVARRRKEVFLATKTAERSYDGAMRELEGSLKRLRTDHLDLVQIHATGPRDDLAAWEKPNGVLTAMRKLRDQKATRFIGVTGHDSAEVMCRAIERYDFDTVLTTFNPTAKRRPFRELVIAVAQKKKMGIMAIKVMGGGLGSLAVGNPIKNDRASYHDDAARQAEPGMLIRYVLGLPIMVAVVGMGSLEQLQVNVRAARDFAPLNDEERQSLENLMA